MFESESPESCILGSAVGTFRRRPTKLPPRSKKLEDWILDVAPELGGMASGFGTLPSRPVYTAGHPSSSRWECGERLTYKELGDKKSVGRLEEVSPILESEDLCDRLSD